MTCEERMADCGVCILTCEERMANYEVRVLICEICIADYRQEFYDTGGDTKRNC